MKTKKIGTSGTTDSFTPRRFNKTRMSKISIANPNLNPYHLAGKKLKRASAPLATDSVIVRT
jgi:hypothetical protein